MSRESVPPPLPISKIASHCIWIANSEIENDFVQRVLAKLSPEDQAAFTTTYACFLIWVVLEATRIRPILSDKEGESVLGAIQAGLAGEVWYRGDAFARIWSEMQVHMQFAITPDETGKIYPVAEMLIASDRAVYTLDKEPFLSQNFGMHILSVFSKLATAGEAYSTAYRSAATPGTDVEGSSLGNVSRHGTPISTEGATLRIPDLLAGVSTGEYQRKPGSQFGSVWGWDGLMMAEAGPEEYAAFGARAGIRLCHGNPVNWLGRDWFSILVYRRNALCQVNIHTSRDKALYTDIHAALDPTFGRSSALHLPDGVPRAKWSGSDGAVVLVSADAYFQMSIRRYTWLQRVVARLSRAFGGQVQQTKA